MQSSASQLRIDIDGLFYAAALHKLRKLELNPRRSMGRYIQGRVLRAKAKQKRKGRKVYALDIRGGHW